MMARPAARLALVALVALVVLVSPGQAQHSEGHQAHQAHQGHATTAASEEQTHRQDKSLSPHPPGLENTLDADLGHYKPAHEGHDKHEYEVFHVDFERVEIPFIIALWIFVSSLAKIGFHMTPKLHHIFPESCLLIVVGIIIGFLLFLTSENPPSTLTPDVFFLFMLPPIILDAGYFMPNRLFFDHLGTILLMAVVGTIFNVLTIGISLWGVGQTGLFGEHDTPGILETLLFSSLISAVDPVAVLAVFEEIHVDEVLYIVVFGESLLNDAVTVVLYNMFESYVEIEEENLTVSDLGKGLASFLVVAGGGTIIGIVWGYVTGFVTRFTNHAPILEPMFVFTMAYLSYLCAEIFHMSGILAITFCGITMKNYVERNVSGKSQTTIKYAMKMLSSSSETIIFMFLGVATIHDEHDWNWWFVVLTIVFCTLWRCIGVVVLVGFANRYRLQKLGAVDQFVMSYGGLRGAVAFALVLLIDPHVVPHAHMFVTTTIAMVYWTVFVQGITMKPLVKFLNVKTSQEKDPTMNERITGRFMDHIMAGMEGILGEFGNLRMRDMYKHLDNKYIKPCLLRENHIDPKILETFETIKNNEVEEYIRNNPSSVMDLTQYRDLKQSKSVAQIFNTSQTVSHVENLDMKEINHMPSKKDLTEAKIHHMLSEEMAKPQKHFRKLSYSRHQLDAEAEDSQINHHTSYKMHTQVRRMMSEKKQRKKNVKTGEGEPEIRVTEEVEGRVAGTSKTLMDERVHALIAEDEQPPPYSKAASGKAKMTGSFRLTVPTSDRHNNKRKSEIRSLLEATQATQDDHKPEWMHTHDHHPPDLHKHAGAAAGPHDNPAFEPDTAGESVALPWHREDDAGLQQQQHFPAWITDILPSSPHSTLLGRSGPSQHREPPSIHREPPSIAGLFTPREFSKRDSLTSFLGEEGWDPRVTSRRNSKDTDFLSVLANPVNIRRSSAPPVQSRQRSLSSIKLRPEEEEDYSEPHLTPIIERKNGKSKKDTVLQFESDIMKSHPY